MADTWTPLTVTEVTTRNGAPYWKVQYLRPDGQTYWHVFPHSTLEWRMAEYQLDDVDEALDIILHELFATDPMDPLHARDDPAARVGMVTRTPGPVLDYDPIRLHNAETIADARTAHRIRIADAKTRVQVTPPDDAPDPLDVIRDRHGVTDDGLREKKALVDATRREYRGQATARTDKALVDPTAHGRDREVHRA